MAPVDNFTEHGQLDDHVHHVVGHRLPREALYGPLPVLRGHRGVSTPDPVEDPQNVSCGDPEAVSEAATLVQNEGVLGLGAEIDPVGTRSTSTLEDGRCQSGVRHDAWLATQADGAMRAST